MDSPDSPVLVQISSPPHTLNSHANLHTFPPTPTSLPEPYLSPPASRTPNSSSIGETDMSTPAAAPSIPPNSELAPAEPGERAVAMSEVEGSPAEGVEDRIVEDRTVEDQTAEDRAVEDRTAEDRTAEDRTAEDRTAEDRTAEDRTAEDRTVGDRTVEDRTVEDRTVEDRTVEEVEAGNTETATETNAHENSGVATDQPASERTTSAEQGISDQAAVDPDPPPPPPPPVTNEPRPDIPDWVMIEEDTSSPDEEELKEIEGSDSDTSALDIKHHEERFFHALDDPEHRPVKKIRLSWTIKGVRGTKERPNRARVIHSPPAFINGFYWHIKFYPRGNNSSALSAYIKCSRKPPKTNHETPESTFTAYEGPHDGEFSDFKPVVDLKIPQSSRKQKQAEGKPSNTEKADEVPSKAEGSDTVMTNTEESSTIAKPEEKAEMLIPSLEQDDWRISAQLGMIIYNPAEPRAGTWMSSEHQFNKHSDDWGFTNFSGPWNEIHIRRRGQRQALLRNDTIAMDAYIRIIDDPSQALWWHPSESEAQWDSKSLTGYFPMGTPPLYHSPGVAGITAWLLLAPFRKMLQDVDTSLWRKDSRVKPQPLICQLQLILFLMRSMRKDDNYVNVNYALEILDNFGETYWDVKTFWESFRRSIELELEGNSQALQQIQEMFGRTGDVKAKITSDSPLKIPVKGVPDIQSGVDKVLENTEAMGPLPDFLPIMLDRQMFDEQKREWKLLYDRVKLNEELNFSKYVADSKVGKYRLYGFMVHVGERTSGKFYSVLRPNGPGSKWLAFEDGDGNKVFSYTKRRVEKFEGFEGKELKSFKGTSQIVYMAMYIRNDRFEEYLPGALEPYDMPNWLKPHLTSRWHGDDIAIKKADEDLEETRIEVYSSESVKARFGLLDMFNLKTVQKPNEHLRTMTVPSTTTFKAVRRQLAEQLSIEKVEKIRLWMMQYSGLGEYMTASMVRITLDDEVSPHATLVRPLCLWMAVLESEEDTAAYGYVDPPVVIEISESASSNSPEDEHISGSENREPNTTTEQAVSMSRDNDPVTNPTVTDDNPAANGDTSANDSQNRDQEIPEQQSASDLVQQSVNDAVRQTVASIEPATAPTAELLRESVPEHPPVEHGHLVEAVEVEENPSREENSSSSPEPVPTVSDVEEDPQVANDRLIASIIAADARAIDAAEDPVVTATLMEGTEVAETTENVPLISDEPSDTPRTDQTRSSSPTSSSVEPIARSQPKSHIYGFIQIFDIEMQNFVVKDSFFAESTAEVQVTMRKHLGYDSEKEIMVWQRVKAYNTSPVSTNATFENISFRDGVDVIVSDVLSDEKKDELLSQGKFVTPSSLSRMLWMTDRRHPVLAYTGNVEILDFGGSYYSGPMLNGRYHGENGTWITSNGHKYVGPFVADEKSGLSGTMTYQNGDVYTGSWLKDEKDGKGTLIEKRTGNKYVGGFSQGKRWGEGVTYWKVADEQKDMCQICYGEEVDALFYDCGHVCACVDCAKQCEACPICRKSIQKVVKMYRA